ncbi:MAG TPA: methyltransferase domain-containing protein [Terriglobia bacterium]|nr:methyltransferase domain-containing protein [Terriglobia bacterium]
MRRNPSVELLDSGLLGQDEIRSNLEDLWRINRYLGGVSGCLHLLAHAFGRTGSRPLRVLEVGAGDGRVAGRVREILRRRGVEADYFTLDRRMNHVKLGHPGPGGIHPVVGNALRLPFKEDSFDLVTCNLLLHQFSGNEAVGLLAALGSVARQAVLINDIERHWIPFLLFGATSWLWCSNVSRLDGLASIRQAYRGPELEELATAAGFDDFEVHRIVPFRLGLVLWRTKPQHRRLARRTVTPRSQEKTHE